LDKTLFSLRESMRLLMATVPTLSEVASNYQDIADLYRIRGNHNLALLYARESIKNGELGRDFNRCAQASAFAALECAQLGNDQEAEDYLRAAYEYVNNVEDKQRPRAQAIVLARAADVAASKNDYEQALSLYSKSQDILQGREGGTLDLIR